MANVHVVDLDDYVKAWASKLDGITRTNSTQSVTLKVDWSRVNVATENPTYESARQTSPQSVILFKSRFDNNSSEQQEHSFSAQSKYTASSSVSLHQCFTLDGRTKVDLSLPEEVLKATSGFGQKLSVTSAVHRRSRRNKLGTSTQRSSCRGKSLERLSKASARPSTPHRSGSLHLYPQQTC